MRRTRCRAKRGRDRRPAAGCPVAGTLAVAATVVALVLSVQNGTGCDTRADPAPGPGPSARQSAPC